MSGRPRLKLYYRSGCSLCEEMQRELLSAQSEYRFELESIDVDSRQELVDSYGHKVPVLTSAEGDEICHYFLDNTALDGYFSGG